MARITCEELNAVWHIKRQIEREQRRLHDLELCIAPTPPVLDGMPHCPPLVYKVERVATLLLDTQQLINSLGEQLAQCKFELLMKLQSFRLSELQERVLSYHYVACLKFGEIAKLMNYTYQHIHRLHNQGLNSLGLTFNQMNSCKCLDHVK